MSKRKSRGRRRTPNALRASRPVRTAASRARVTRRRTRRAPSEVRSRACSIRRTSRDWCLTLRPRRCISSFGTVDSTPVESSSPAATPEQLTSVLDLDLWRHAQPGRDEQFDADRFGEWLEVLVDTGETRGSADRRRPRRAPGDCRTLPLPACLRPAAHSRRPRRAMTSRWTIELMTARRAGAARV